MLITDIRIICTFLSRIYHMQVPLEFNLRVHISNLNKLSHTVKRYKRITSIRRLHIPRYSLSFIDTPSTAALPHRKLASVGTSRDSFRAEDSDKSSGVPRNVVRGVGVQQIQLRTEDRENGDLEAVAP